MHRNSAGVKEKDSIQQTDGSNHLHCTTARQNTATLHFTRVFALVVLCIVKNPVCTQLRLMYLHTFRGNLFP